MEMAGLSNFTLLREMQPATRHYCYGDHSANCFHDYAIAMVSSCPVVVLKELAEI